jgi:PAS domain S-box-containing protein
MPEYELSLKTQAELIELAYMAMIVRDLDSCILFWNHRAEEVYGWTKDEALGQTTDDLLRTKYPISRESMDETLERTGRWEGLLLHTCRSGKVITVLSRQALQRDAEGKPVAILEVNLDVTEASRRQSKIQADFTRQLADERAFLEAVLHQMPAGVMIASAPAGEMLLTNRQVDHILGQTFVRTGAIYNFKDTRAFHPTSREVYGPHEWPLSRAIASGEVVEGEEIDIERPDGSYVTISASAAPIRDAAGAIIAGVVAFRDVTESKKLERALAAAHAELREKAAELEQRVAERTSRLQLLHEIDRAILAAQSPEVTAQLVVTHLRQALACQRVDVSLLDVDEGGARVLATDDTRALILPSGTQYEIDVDSPLVLRLLAGEIYSSPDPLDLSGRLPVSARALIEGFGSFAAIPLMVEGRLIGALNLGATDPAAFTLEDLALARQVADSLAVAIHHGQVLTQLQTSHALLQGLARRLVEVQETERKHIARELHDEAGQALTSLSVSLGLLQRRNDCPAPIREQLESLKQLTDEVMDGLHRLAANLRPATLDRLGLVPALTQHLQALKSQQTGLEVTFITLGLDDTRLAPEAETTLYRVIVESVTNVVRHANARHIGVVLERRGSQAVAIIEDDGTGFNLAEVQAKGRLGVFGMRERAEMLGGSLTIESSPGVGTTIFVEIPCRESAPAEAPGA